MGSKKKKPMGLKFNLYAIDRKTSLAVTDEFSKDFGEDHGLMDAIGIPIHDNINNGDFEVQQWWIPILQPHFKQIIDLSKYKYFISFDYRDKW